VGRKHLLQKLGLVSALMLTITAAAYGQNSSPWDGTKPRPPATRKMPPANPGGTSPPNPGVCPKLRRIGPFQTSDDAELAAQSARYQLIPTSSIYSQGLPDSYFNPLRYFFDAYIFTQCKLILEPVMPATPRRAKNRRTCRRSCARARSPRSASSGRLLLACRRS
jgi:hypothetical protein